MKRRLSNLFGLFGLCAHGSLAAVGLAVAPMEQLVSGREAATYVASNMEEKAVAVEVIVETWDISEDGEEIRQPSTDLVAFPRQFILKGSTAKNVKVGRRDRSSTPEIEKCYRVTIRELPISLEPEEPGTFHVYRASAYRTSYYVQPKKPRAEVEVLTASLNNGRFSILLRNSGNAHIHLRNPEITLGFANGERLDVTDLDVYAPIAGENMHAQRQRRFELNLEEWIAPGQEVSDVTLRFQDEGVLEAQPLQITL